MSDENKKCCSCTETGEPTAGRSSAPMWIIVVTLVLLFTGGLFLDSHGGWFDAKVYSPYNSQTQLESFQPKSGAAAAMARGKTVYESVCGICHGADGLGKPGQAPPLAGSEWVTAKGVDRLTHIPLMGLAGLLKVNGKDWNMNMAAMGAALPEEDLAAVLTYIRSSWGNSACAVTGDEVKKIRAGMGKSVQPMTGEQLMTLPE